MFLDRAPVHCLLHKKHRAACLLSALPPYISRPRRSTGSHRRSVNMSTPNLESEKGVYGNHGNSSSVSAGERRKAALAEIDEASFSWFHAKACIVAGELRLYGTHIIMAADAL